MNPISPELRKEYHYGAWDEAAALTDPLAQFRVWFAAAVAAGLVEANAMTVATATPTGRPSARIMLLKEVDAEGFVFFTNYASRKGAELLTNPWAQSGERRAVSAERRTQSGERRAESGERRT